MVTEQTAVAPNRVWRCHPRPAPLFPSLWRNGTMAPTGAAPSRVGRCTPSVAVLAPTRLALGQVQMVTATGVGVHRTGGGDAPRQHPEPGFATSSLPTSSPLQMCQHHQVFTTLCMCVSFSQIFFKGLALFSPCHSILTCMQI
jgi:hypothetical protein